MSHTEDELANELRELAKTMGIRSRADELDQLAALAQARSLRETKQRNEKERRRPQLALIAGICVAALIGVGVIAGTVVNNGQKGLPDGTSGTREVLIDPWAEHSGGELPAPIVDAKQPTHKLRASFLQTLSLCDGDGVCAVDAAIYEIDSLPESDGHMIWNEAVNLSSLRVISSALDPKGKAAIVLVAHDENEGRVVYLQPGTYELLSHEQLWRN